MKERKIDVSFSACNFLSFTSIKDAELNSEGLYSLWNTLPDAIKTGDLNEQLSWQGDKKNLIPILYSESLTKLGYLISKILFVLGLIVIALCFFGKTNLMPYIGIGIVLAGLVLYSISWGYDLVRPKFKHCMHTHGVFVWGEISEAEKLEKIIKRLS